MHSILVTYQQNSAVDRAGRSRNGSIHVDDDDDDGVVLRTDIMMDTRSQYRSSIVSK